jgi:hypothetical protein
MSLGIQKQRELGLDFHLEFWEKTTLYCVLWRMGQLLEKE